MDTNQDALFASGADLSTQYSSEEDRPQSWSLPRLVLVAAVALAIFVAILLLLYGYFSADRPAPNRIEAPLAITVPSTPNADTIASGDLDEPNTSVRSSSDLPAAETIEEAAPPETSGTARTETNNASSVPVNGAALQIGVFQTSARAEAAWALFGLDHPEIAPSLTSRVEQVELQSIGGVPLGERGTWYRLMTGPFESYAGAREACENIKMRGGDCFAIPPFPIDIRR